MMGPVNYDIGSHNKGIIGNGLSYLNNFSTKVKTGLLIGIAAGGIAAGAILAGGGPSGSNDNTPFVNPTPTLETYVTATPLPTNTPTNTPTPEPTSTPSLPPLPEFGPASSEQITKWLYTALEIAANSPSGGREDDYAKSLVYRAARATVYDKYNRDKVEKYMEDCLTWVGEKPVGETNEEKYDLGHSFPEIIWGTDTTDLNLEDSIIMGGLVEYMLGWVEHICYNYLDKR